MAMNSAKASSELRSAQMAKIKSTNTKPEVAVRKIIHGMGYRFRINYKKMPGSPDLVMPKYKLAIFVHGCFWHRHKGCRKTRMPKTNVEFWREKFESNIKRDRLVQNQIRKLGWGVLIIWECEIVGVEKLQRKILRKIVKSI